MSHVPRLVLYARTSTDDQQSPADSLEWQRDRAMDLAAGRAEIVRIAHEVDVTRALPWRRRPEAARLLAEAADPRRDWDGIVVGEPQRAFGSAFQASLVISQLAEYGASLWVPEAGGPVDPDSDAHDMLMTMFGVLSRAERNRLRSRVGAAMRAMAKKGDRFLGGRPPFGYRLVPTSALHPNPEKARHGIHLTKLEIDPDRAQVVRRIFAWRLEGVGFRSIAMRLDDAGVPSPSAADRVRNPHRAGDGWAVSAVRAIVMNPRYKGTERFGAYKKVERLYDPTDPAAGHVTRMVRADPDNVITVPGAVPAIVDELTWQRAQPTAAPVGRGPRPDRPSAGRYALRGLLVCDACGRTMQGHMVRRRTGAERLGYRCAVRADYPGRKDHTSNLFVAEARLLPALDTWLGQLTDPERIDETVEAIVAADSDRASEPPEVRRARRALADAHRRLDGLLAGLEQGIDPKLAAARIQRAQADAAAAEAVITGHHQATPAPLTEHAVKAFLNELGGLQGLLAEAAAGERRRIYDAAGVTLRYRRGEDGREALVAGLRVGFSRVGGGT